MGVFLKWVERRRRLNTPPLFYSQDLVLDVGQMQFCAVLLSVTALPPVVREGDSKTAGHPGLYEGRQNRLNPTMGIQENS